MMNLVPLLLLACTSSPTLDEPTPADICYTLKEKAPEACYRMALDAVGDEDRVFYGLSAACEAGFKDSCSQAPHLLKGSSWAVSVVSGPCFKEHQKDACQAYLQIAKDQPKYATEKLLAQAKAILKENP